MTTIADVKRFCSQVDAEYVDAKTRYSHLNQIEQQILHYVEVVDYSGADGAKLMKKLKEVRRERRVAKREMEELAVIVNRMNDGKLTTMKYQPAKVHIMKLSDILAG